MNKLKFYLWNAFYSSLIGMAVMVAGIMVAIWHYSFQKIALAFLRDPLHFLIVLLFNLFFCMAVGAIIGTVSLFFVFQIFLKLTQRPLIGFISNFLVVAALNIAGALATGIRNYQQFIQSLWFWALPVSEILGAFLVYIWYKRQMFYKEKLELKKALLRKTED